MDGLRKAIAIDFDGCLCTDAFPAIGEPNWAVINRAKAEQKTGTGLILWTCREGQVLQDAITACESWGLTFDAVNESLPDWIEEFGTRPRKVGASEYWDDKAVRVEGQQEGAIRPINANRLFDFLTEQLDKETGAYSKGRNTGINIARSALHDKTITPTLGSLPR